MGASMSRRKSRSPRSKYSKKRSDQRSTSSHSSLSTSVKGTTIQGRVYHNVESSVYLFPMDEIEQDRLHGQHFGLKALFGGNILAPVRDIIDLDNDCHVLDVGCGPGSWLLDLATSHPNSKFVGVDIVDMFPSAIKPPNTEFHVASILDGLPMFSDNSFDLVQMRLFAAVLKKDQWVQTLTELKRVCRPGGIIQLVEIDYKVTGNQFVNTFTTKLVNIMASRGQDGQVAKRLAPLLSEVGFINPQTDHRPIAGGWDGPLSHEIWLDIKNAMSAAAPIVSPGYGMDSAGYLAYLNETMENIRDSGAYFNWWGCCAKKPIF
ncbi:S-adenosyl-L-methionine-dependent methyltransferase [Umbelopsis sp. PMI_123]|nr:S-adenosyl-L-methionine-dependent methyltransferase [Umbelopsis sp. PMI_123]